MEWREMLIDAYGRITEALEETLKGLTRKDLDELPKPDCNSIGWLAWHTARIQDYEISGLMGEPQLWITEKWHVKFKRDADPEDNGFGHTPEQVAAFKSPAAGVFLDYYRAVQERTAHYLHALSPKDLDRKLDEPWFQPVPTVGVRIVSVLADCHQHVGQAAYVRGLLKGKGWASA